MNEQRDNSGALFANDKKGNDKAPDAKGNATVNGRAVSVSAWWRTSKAGTEYLSLAFDEPRERQAAPFAEPPPQAPAPPPRQKPEEQPTLPADDIPF